MEEEEEEEEEDVFVNKIIHQYRSLFSPVELARGTLDTGLDPTVA